MSFSENYTKARETFRSQALRLGGDVQSLEVVEHPEHGMLTIDAALFGQGSKRALVISSGVHGVEGFAGSAIQCDLMRRGLPEDLGVVLLHAVNPYGMACLRRVNENNVDLHRNVLPAGTPYAGVSDGYRDLNSMLNPESPHGGFDAFLPRALLKIAQYGMPKLRQAVAGGQYEFPKGLFWGGAKLERSPALLREALPRWLAETEQAVFIDIHTGLGRFGSHAVLVDAEAGSDECNSYILRYGDRVQPLDPGQSVAYGITGALVEGVTKGLDASIEILSQEFGTRPPIAVIRALRAENRAHFWGGDVDGSKRLIRDAFYPRSEAWENAVLTGGRHLIERACARLRAPG